MCFRNQYLFCIYFYLFIHFFILKLLLIARTIYTVIIFVKPPLPPHCYLFSNICKTLFWMPLFCVCVCLRMYESCGACTEVRQFVLSKD